MRTNRIVWILLLLILVLLVANANTTLKATVVKANDSSGDTPSGMPALNPDGTSIPNAHVVFGSVTLPASSTPINIPPVNFTGAAAFSSAQSYVCFHSAGQNISDAISGTQMRVRWGISQVTVVDNFVCIGR